MLWPKKLTIRASGPYIRELTSERECIYVTLGWLSGVQGRKSDEQVKYTVSAYTAYYFKGPPFRPKKLTL